MFIKKSRDEMIVDIVKKAANLPTDELSLVAAYVSGYAARGDREDQKKQPEVKGA